MTGRNTQSGEMSIRGAYNSSKCEICLAQLRTFRKILTFADGARKLIAASGSGGVMTAGQGESRSGCRRANAGVLSAAQQHAEHAERVGREDAPADRAERRAAEEVAEPGRLDQHRQQGGGAQPRRQHGAVVTAREQRLPQLLCGAAARDHIDADERPC